MRRFLTALSIGILAVLSVQVSSGAQQAANSQSKAPDTQFEVLSPWADIDPIPLRGISPRISSLAGKKIGIFVNPKRAAMPIAESIIARLGSMYPDAQTVIYHSVGANVNEIETDNKEKFTAWAKGIDAAIAVVGD
jgi:ABC-type lipopolysaccharide export system ATPase subunit